MSIINTRKLRKIGNSNILTISKEVIKVLNVNERLKIAFNVDNGKVTLEAVNTQYKEIDVLSMAEQVSNQKATLLW